MGECTKVKGVSLISSTQLTANDTIDTIGRYQYCRLIKKKSTVSSTSQSKTHTCNLTSKTYKTKLSPQCNSHFVSEWQCSNKNSHKQHSISSTGPAKVQ